MPGPIAVIPSRYAATRLPGKPLVPLLGKPMVQHVYERCLEAGCFAKVIVATDDQRIAQAVEGFGGLAHLTSPTCASGTDRVAEVARALGASGQDVFLNVQGDEPAVHPDALRTLASLFEAPEVAMGTLVRTLHEAERGNPAVVKVVLDEAWNALYFSRADVPFQREASSGPVARWGHVGLYGYRASVLARLAAWAPTALERWEALEQLRALGHGVRIACRQTPHAGQAVDVPDDVPKAERALEQLFASR